MAGHVQECSWRLSDAAATARSYPYTFWKPSDQLIGMLKPGDSVKLIFDIVHPAEGEPSAERMWGEITDITEDGFVGRLDNEPYHISDLEVGDMIAFGPEHIIASSVQDPVPDPTLRWALRCLASKSILQNGKRVGFFYRDEPMRAEDSGWIFLAADESQEYLDDYRNLQVVSLGAVLSCDDRMVDLLDHVAPVEFHWDEREGRFVATASNVE